MTVRLLVGILGLALGVLVGLVLVLANPLPFIDRLQPLPADMAPQKAYRWEDYRGIDGRVADLLGIGRRTREAALIDPALTNLRIGIIVLPAGDGVPAALAIKVASISDQNSLWRARLGTLDYWNIFWPGEGSVFATGYSNFWTVTRDLFWATARGGERELLDSAYMVSAPPPAGHVAGVTGAAGRYAGFTGQVRESLIPSESGPAWTIALQANPRALMTK